MKRPFVVGIIGGFLGIANCRLYVIFSPASSDVTLSGVQACTFFQPGPDGCGDSEHRDPFPGWMLLSSAVWITLSVPLARVVQLARMVHTLGHFARDSGCTLFYGTTIRECTVNRGAL